MSEKDKILDQIAELKENQKELEETIILNTCREIMKPYCPIRIADLTQIEENNKQIKKLKDKMKRTDLLYCQGCGTFIENQKCWCYGCMESTRRQCEEGYQQAIKELIEKFLKRIDWIMERIEFHTENSDSELIDEITEEYKKWEGEKIK